MDEWTTGRKLIRNRGKADFQIVDYVQCGLQPYDEVRKEIRPPNVEALKRALESSKRRMIELEERYNGFDGIAISLEEWCKISHMPIDCICTSDDDIYYSDGSHNKVRENYEYLKASCDRMECALQDSWKGYKLHENSVDRQDVISSLLDAYYKMKDILELENQSNQEFAPQDRETLMQSIQMSYVSDEEIRIKVGDKNAKIYNKKELGFIKEQSKAWKALIGILNSSDHYYHVGIARGAGGGRKNTYDTAQKRLVEINKKLVTFLNNTFETQLPKSFKLYELVPEKREAPGTYRFKFRILSNEDDNLKRFEELTQKELLSKIKTLSRQRRKLSGIGGEEAEARTSKIKDQLYAALVIAHKKEWIKPNRARNLLDPQDDPLPVEVAREGEGEDPIEDE